MVALNAFIGSFKGAAASGGGVSPSLGDWEARKMKEMEDKCGFKEDKN